MPTPQWVWWILGITAALSWLGAYLGQVYPHVAYWCFAAVGTLNAFLAAVGYASSTSSSSSTSG